MGKPRFTRPWLESLSTAEITEIALSRGIDIPEGIERVFIIEELLDLMREIDSAGTAPAAPSAVTARSLMFEPVPLPQRYHITYLDVLIRDPLWVFACWEIKTAEREALENSPGFGGYFLRVSPVDKAGRCTGGDIFMIGVGIEDNSWYLGFPPVENRGGFSRFRVELCSAMGDGGEILAQAEPFVLPALLPPQGDLSGQSRLRVLSGLDEIPVLRNAGWLSRPPAAEECREPFPGQVRP
ncbi:MAG: DUF4912 domain-containing protein [Spirochaetaceae bacterium]|jgi:hypothetical protein|nr:DUF4912 domain-containing protein [Spirochaetaceae bacterium]